MDREVNDLRSGVRFNRRSGSLSGFSLCASAIRGHRGDKATPGGGMERSHFGNPLGWPTPVYIFGFFSFL